MTPYNLQASLSPPVGGETGLQTNVQTYLTLSPMVTFFHSS